MRNIITSMIKYQFPTRWSHYNLAAIVGELAEAKGAVMSLRAFPYQKRWVAELQEMQLKLEVGGSSKIEGADFAGNELDQAMRETPEQLHTRSQRQAHALTQAYRWISTVKADFPISENFIRELHRQIVEGADDDHCPPGKIRERDNNVNFGVPQHRGAEGGEECAAAFSGLVQALNGEFRGHDPLIQALATHYHFAAMHPFMDGNGRTARALEALLLGRAGLHSTLFIAMSNYYYEEKNSYLAALAAVRASGYDLTAFLKFGLMGIARQAKRLADLIRQQISKELYRSMLHDFFTRLVSTRKRVIGKRQLELAEYLLRHGPTEFELLCKQLETTYSGVSNPRKAIVRDINHLQGLKALRVSRYKDTQYQIEAMLDWPTKVTESEFFEAVRKLSRAKTTSFLAAVDETKEKGPLSERAPAMP